MTQLAIQHFTTHVINAISNSSTDLACSIFKIAKFCLFGLYDEKWLNSQSPLFIKTFTTLFEGSLNLILPTLELVSIYLIAFFTLGICYDANKFPSIAPYISNQYTQYLYQKVEYVYDLYKYEELHALSSLYEAADHCGVPSTLRTRLISILCPIASALFPMYSLFFIGFITFNKRLYQQTLTPKFTDTFMAMYAAKGAAYFQHLNKHSENAYDNRKAALSYLSRNTYEDEYTVTNGQRHKLDTLLFEKHKDDTDFALSFLENKNASVFSFQKFLRHYLHIPLEEAFADQSQNDARFKFFKTIVNNEKYHHLLSISNSCFFYIVFVAKVYQFDNDEFHNLVLKYTSDATFFECDREKESPDLVSYLDRPPPFIGNGIYSPNFKKWQNFTLSLLKKYKSSENTDPIKAKIKQYLRDYLSDVGLE